MPRVKSYLKLRKAREQPESAVQYHCHEGNVFMYVCIHVHIHLPSMIYSTYTYTYIFYIYLHMLHKYLLLYYLVDI